MFVLAFLYFCAVGYIYTWIPYRAKTEFGSQGVGYGFVWQQRPSQKWTAVDLDSQPDQSDTPTTITYLWAYPDLTAIRLRLVATTAFATAALMLLALAGEKQ
jgi:hypothetical protein